VPFTRGGQTAEVVEQAARTIEEQAPTEVGGTLIDLLAVYAARSLRARSALETIRRALMSKDLIEESPLYQQWMAESREKVARAAVLVLWRVRFGEPAANIVAALEREHSADTLDGLVGTLPGAADVNVARGLLGLDPEAAPA
jgi:hypothetical protein